MRIETMPSETEEFHRQMGLRSFDRYPHLRAVILECQQRWQKMDVPMRISVLLTSGETLARVVDDECPASTIWRIAELNNL
jgi:hypothetical protein